MTQHGIVALIFQAEKYPSSSCPSHVHGARANSCAAPPRQPELCRLRHSFSSLKGVSQSRLHISKASMVTPPARGGTPLPSRSQAVEAAGAGAPGGPIMRSQIRPREGSWTETREDRASKESRHSRLSPSGAGTASPYDSRLISPGWSRLQASWWGMGTSVGSGERGPMTPGPIFSCVTLPGRFPDLPGCAPYCFAYGRLLAPDGRDVPGISRVPHTTSILPV